MARARPPTASRRAVLGAGASLIAAGSAAAAAPGGSAEAEARRILERYQGFGDKASGGPGDEASGAWIEGELKSLGYACRRQPFDVPAYAGDPPALSAGEASATLIPQAIVAPTPGVTGPLYVYGQGRGAIALIVLPHARWSTAKGSVERQVKAAAAAGARAAVIVTTGPTGEACALNAPVDQALFDIPAAVMAPRDAEPFLRVAAAGGTAGFRMAGRAFRRPAYNVTARLDRGAAKTLVISTPRSGWFSCAGERGSGLAAWLLLARWAAQARLPVNLALVATSGHEYEYAGGERFIAEVAPKPAQTALWVHLGANVAARDWHERGPLLAPLPSADPQRFLLASPPLVAAARVAFAGQPGLEQPYAADPAQAAGEFASILKGGYDPVVAIFGSHRFHHTRSDDLRCVAPGLIPPVAEAMATVIAAALNA
ncbi:hypothetical protein [Phenylobacterium sp.]|uniref:hypothetical protein n=1 Tax=Phenylobacterium sp. TaxID=1871053 RepID=UPI0025F0D939|nr:hypothetical protein [Phenylobacterium sp.]